MSYDYFDEEYDDPDEWTDDDEEDDEWVLNCGDPECCMNFAPHFRSECYTPEMYEGYVAEVTREEQPPACSCHHGEGAMFHLPDCALRRGSEHD